MDPLKVEPAAASTDAVATVSPRRSTAVTVIARPVDVNAPTSVDPFANLESALFDPNHHAAALIRLLDTDAPELMDLIERSSTATNLAVTRSFIFSVLASVQIFVRKVLISGSRPPSAPAAPSASSSASYESLPVNPHWISITADNMVAAKEYGQCIRESRYTLRPKAPPLY